MHEAKKALLKVIRDDVKATHPMRHVNHGEGWLKVGKVIFLGNPYCWIVQGSKGTYRRMDDNFFANEGFDVEE